VTLRQVIEREIGERGPIPFSRYMELCLYHPELGYYSRPVEQFGKAGDFYTSSDVQAVFGRLLARQFEEIWRELGSPAAIEILELGPGRGLFAQDVLDWSEKKFPAFFEALHFSLVERSPVLRGKLDQILARFLAKGKASLVSSHGGAEAVPLQAGHRVGKPAVNPDTPLIVFANEFFDALPVEIISLQGTLRIGAEGNRLMESYAPPSAEEGNLLDRYGVHPGPGERIEVPLQAWRYMAGLAASIPSGAVIAIDYGYTREEQRAGRHRGTLMAYRQHSAIANPYQAPGEQDLTAHVNFTALAAAAEEGGLRTQPLLTQSQFLMGIGEPNQFADAFADCHLPAERAKVALQLKHLVSPAGMGECFRVLVGAKAVDPERVARWSGLSFARSRLAQGHQ
jgi:SAM-dependent MidA family methyltransferase